ncbi:hypothetical protein [Streptomyces gobiensis]|uniref:hypothetical protein n=1 Tax=Streptomyces gobiensis TaxID=2875706 RepID=UPI001E5D78BA|nr:hypothetical protein [Streptomyces gobiensis]UGY93932.1 hypothetical protein test1122_20900 [Streptomyces gobiensis]
MSEAICLLYLWFKMLFSSGSGSHRSRSGSRPRAVVPAPRTPLVRTAACPASPPLRRATRLPYGRHMEPLDGDAVAMVRPYVVVQEQEDRRRALELALDGVDVPESVWVHGVQVGMA